MILMVKIGKKDKWFILGVVPGNANRHKAVKGLYNKNVCLIRISRHCRKLAGSVAGTVPLFSFKEELILSVDPSLNDHEFIYFNAARLIGLSN